MLPEVNSLLMLMDHLQNKIEEVFSQGNNNSTVNVSSAQKALINLFFQLLSIGYGMKSPSYPAAVKKAAKTALKEFEAQAKESIAFEALFNAAKAKFYFERECGYLYGVLQTDYLNLSSLKRQFKNHLDLAKELILDLSQIRYFCNATQLLERQRMTSGSQEVELPLVEALIRASSNYHFYLVSRGLKESYSHSGQLTQAFLQAQEAYRQAPSDMTLKAAYEQAEKASREYSQKAHEDFHKEVNKFLTEQVRKDIFDLHLINEARKLLDFRCEENLSLKGTYMGFLEETLARSARGQMSLTARMHLLRYQLEKKIYSYLRTNPCEEKEIRAHFILNGDSATGAFGLENYLNNFLNVGNSADSFSSAKDFLPIVVNFLIEQYRVLYRYDEAHYGGGRLRDIIGEAIESISDIMPDEMKDSFVAVKQQAKISHKKKEPLVFSGPGLQQ